MLHSEIGMKAEMEITPTIITVLLALIMTIVLMIIVIGQYIDTKSFLTSYTDISVAKEAAYAFASAYSTERYNIMDPFRETYRFAMLDSKKLDDPYLLQKSLLNLKLNAKFTVKDLGSNPDNAGVWTFEYIGLPPTETLVDQQDLSPQGAAAAIPEQPRTFESLRMFMPIYNPINKRITNGVLYVEPY